MNIHSTAIIHPGARLAPTVTIGPFCFVDDQVQLDDGVVLGPQVTILRYTSVGAGTVVHANAVLGDKPQDIAFQDQESYVRIGKNCLIREGVTIHRGTKPQTATEVGDHCFLMANSHVGHNARLDHHVILANGVLLGGYVEVGDRAFLSGNSAFHQFIRVGRVAMVSGLCAMSKDIPPYCATQGASGNIIFGLNVVGMRRAGMTAADRLAVKRAFNILYRSGLNVTQALARLKQEFASGPAAAFAAFVETSRRGICRWVGQRVGQAAGAEAGVE